MLNTASHGWAWQKCPNYWVELSLVWSGFDMRSTTSMMQSPDKPIPKVLLTHIDHQLSIVENQLSTAVKKCLICFCLIVF